MGDTVYGVDSCHINVQAGDSAVHLLVQLSGTTPIGKPVEAGRPYVLSAVLIDGGDNANNTPDLVFKFIREELPRRYDFSTAVDLDGKSAKFDSVIVTHWDKDHYEGLAKVLSKDVEKIFKDNPAIAADDIQISFFKYAPKSKGRTAPQTTVYAPLWLGVGSGGRKTKTRGAPTTRWGSSTTGTGQAFLTVRFASEWMELSKIKSLDTIAKLDYTDLLGMDFFRQKKLGRDVVPQLTSPAALLQKHQATAPAPQWPGAAGMYCLGVAAKTLPRPSSSSTVTGGVAVAASGGVGVVNKLDSATNASSVSCAIIWPGSGVSPPRVSHYFAGDAEYQTEESIVAWVGNTKVRHVKASHHGSATSFPVAMLEQWQPDNIVASAGVAHGHPRWELLVYLFYHSLKRFVASDGRDRAWLHPTCFPYWFGKDKDTKEYLIPIQKRNGKESSRISTAAFEKDEEPYKTYRSRLQDVLNGLRNRGAITRGGLVDELHDYQRLEGDYRVHVRHLWAFCCEKVWRALSPVTPAYYPASEKTPHVVYLGPTSTTPLPQKTVLCVLVKSRASGRAEDETAASYDTAFRAITPATEGVTEEKSPEPLPMAAQFLQGQFRLGGPTATGGSVVLVAGTKDGLREEELDDEDEDEPEGWEPGVEVVLAPPPPPTVADEPVPPIPDVGYFYCSARTAQPQPSPRAATLTGLLDAFVSRLHMAWLGIAASPASPTQDVGVLSSDELYVWLDGVFGIHTFTVQGTPSTITEATLALSFAGIQLEFSSAAVPWVFGLPQATVPPTIPPPPGSAAAAPLLYSDDLLILGLGATVGSAGPVSLQAACDELRVQVPTFLADAAAAVQLDLTPVGEPGHRNTLWFTPGMEYRSTLRLAFAVRGIDPNTVPRTDPLNSRVFSALQLVVHSASIIVRKSATFTYGGTIGPAILRRAQMAFSVQVALQTGGTRNPTVDATLVYNPDDGSMRVVVLCDPKDGLTPYLTWIEGRLGVSTNIMGYLKADWIPTPRRVSLDLAAGTLAIERAEIDFELTAPWGDADVVFLFSFSWTPSQQQMSAHLWPGPLADSVLPPGMTPAMLESYEAYDQFSPTLSTAAKSIHLLDLLPRNLSSSQLNLPGAVNPDVFGLGFSLTRTVGAAGGVTLAFEFYGSLGANPSPDPDSSDSRGASDFPQIELQSLGLDLRYTTDRSPGPSPADTAFNLNLTLRIGIYPRDSMPDYGLATLYGSLNYSRVSGVSSWQIDANLDQLMVGHLASFFQSDSRDGVMDLVEHIEVDSLHLLYDYGGPGGTGNHFLFEGTLLLGAMQFWLEFEHWTDHWSFSAHLLAPDVNETIGSVLAYLTPDVALPSFIGGVHLLDGNTEIGLDVRKDQLLQADGTATDYIVFKTDITIAHVSMTFIQYKTKSWAKPKRVFRAALTGPLKVSSIPVVEALTQPFDDLYFLYVQDGSGAEQPRQPPGVLRQELPLLNGKLVVGEPPFLFQETHKPQPDGSMSPTDTIINAGLRFAVVATINNQPTVVLDHEFGSAAAPPKPTPPPTPPPPPLTTVSAPVPAPAAVFAVQDPGAAPAAAPGDSSMAVFHKTIGPLTISNIGVRFQDSTLTILLDATFQLGPIALALLGFGLALDFSQDGANLLNPPSARGTISGLGFGFAQPPVVIDGLLEHRPTADGSDLYLGGVVAALEPYLFAAAGCYGVLADATKIVALFCLLEGPLIELEFAEVTGICGGFGYNTSLRLPTVDTVASYPLVDHAAIAASPLDTMGRLLDPRAGCVSISKGSIWLAAGLDVDAFKLLSMKAVVAVEFTASDIGLGIFADVKASFPAPAAAPTLTGTEVVVAAPAPAAAFAYVELGIVATVDFGAGVMMVQAQLAPSSFILDPACHLTGGYALGYWFGASPHAGDWVFTIGGYHPRYAPPPYYPTPPRLAIAWSLDNCLAITGQAYFALTPKVAMGGGELRAALSLSPLYAYFDAFADFLVSFAPFYFVGDAGIDVGVQFTLDLWICTIHINVDIGAQLYLEGPPVHGHVHVDFWVFGFDIHFGDASVPRPDPPTLREFYYLLKQAEPATPSPPPAAASSPSSSSAAAVLGTEADIDTIDGAHQLSCVGGLITSPNQAQTTDVDATWPVRAGAFRFRVASPFASDSVSITAGASVPGSGRPIYARPMQNPNPIASTTSVDVARVEPGGALEGVSGFRVQGTLANVPASMWKQYSEDEDPLSTKNTTSGNGNYLPALLDGTQATLLTHLLAVTILPPVPYWPGPAIEPLAAFGAADAASQPVLDGRPPPAPPLEPASAAWAPQPFDDPDAAWTRVPADWAAPSLPPADTVAVWAAAMDGWAPEDVPPGDAPAELVKGFVAYFLAPPGETAAAV